MSKGLRLAGLYDGRAVAGGSTETARNSHVSAKRGKLLPSQAGGFQHITATDVGLKHTLVTDTDPSFPRLPHQNRFNRHSLLMGSVHPHTTHATVRGVRLEVDPPHQAMAGMAMPIPRIEEALRRLKCEA